MRTSRHQAEEDSAPRRKTRHTGRLDAVPSATRSELHDDSWMRDEDVIDVLTDLIACCRATQARWTACAAQAKSSLLGSVLGSRVDECRATIEVLLDEATQLGGTPRLDGHGDSDGEDAAPNGHAPNGSTAAASADLGLLEECERAERALVEGYRSALRHELPPHILTLVEKQCRAAKARCGQFTKLVQPA